LTDQLQVLEKQRQQQNRSNHRMLIKQIK